jgi:Tol biopolymer transport system component
MRQALHRYEYRGWAMEPIIRGKTKSLSKIEELLRKFPDNQDLKALFSHINNNGKWCVILGYNKGGDVRWSDIAHNDLKSDVEAEAIVNNFS